MGSTPLFIRVWLDCDSVATGAFIGSSACDTYNVNALISASLSTIYRCNKC